MHKERLNKKDLIKKRIEQRHEHLVFIERSGQKNLNINRPVNVVSMNERDKLRNFGGRKEPIKTEVNIEPISNTEAVKPISNTEAVKPISNSNFLLSRTIPKRIFFYWSGSDLSWMRYMTLYSFRKMNPDWEMVLYVSENNMKKKGWKSYENQDYFTYKGGNYFNRLEDLNIKIEKAEFPESVKDKVKDMSPIHKGDLYRYYQLFLNGGFYCDMDVLFFRPIDDFYNKIINGNYDTIIHEYKSQYSYTLTIGFLGASINNEYYKNLFEFGIDNYNDKTKEDYQSMGIILINKMFTDKIFSPPLYEKIIIKYPHLNFYNIPTTLIYNFDFTQIKNCFTHSLGINKFYYNSIGYHWYGGGVESQKYNNILTDKNYKNHKTTFSTIANEVISMKVDDKGYVIQEKIKMPKISIVMTSYNRAELLNLGLSSLAKQKIDYSLEIVVVNDGADDNTKKICDSYRDKLNIKYVFSGYRNSNGLIYRSSPIPINIGIKAATGDIIILSCAEIYHLNNSINEIVMPLLENHNYLTIPKSMYFDNLGGYTKTLLNNQSCDTKICETNNDDVQMPFLLGVWKQHILDIGGYDEDLIGYASEDNDFADRLKLNGCEYYRVDAKIVHLYHGKRCSGKIEHNNPDWVYNNKLYTERKGIIVRNQDKKWGKNIGISIVTAYYNRKEQFYRTLKSIAKSDFKDFELIAVDDCSSTEHRLEEYLNEFSFLKIIRIEPENKWYVNSSVPFNIGIRAAIGNIIIIQNPECLHVHDILTYVNKNINDSKLITMSTYALDEKSTELLFKKSNNSNDIIKFIKKSPQELEITRGGQHMGWYNHSTYRPVCYHFCSAITKKNIDKLNGFDERYAYGIGYEDNEFVERIKRLGLELIIVDDYTIIHQYHPKVFYKLPDFKKLNEKNKKLFNNVTMLETTYRAK